MSFTFSTVGIPLLLYRTVNKSGSRRIFQIGGFPSFGLDPLAREDRRGKIMKPLFKNVSYFRIV